MSTSKKMCKNLINKGGTMNVAKQTLLVLVIIIFSSSFVFAQTPPVAQTGGGQLQQKKALEKSKDLQQRIKDERPGPKDEAPVEVEEEDTGEKILVKDITVEGATLISQESIESIITQYEGQEISLKTMQKVADLITDEYRKKGFATSRAYIPPQSIQEGTLIIRVVEGLLGKIEIRGNKYFKTKLLQKRLRIEEGQPLDYSDLQKSLTYMNEHPDRTAKVVLVPGAQPGTTDVVLEVEDNFPFHVGYEFDNYNSRFLDRYRHSVILEHNNLLGFDDKAYFKYQMSHGDFYKLKNARYSIPLSNTLELGAHWSKSRTKLGREFESVDARGYVTMYGLFLNKALISNPDLDLRLNFGFDYKDIDNWLVGIVNSRDELRIAKAGFDLDVSDKWGRSILTAELDAGIPDIMGGMDDQIPTTVDIGSSRAGAGGKFYKGVFNFFRFQPGPFNTSILWKNQAQYTPYPLVASEQFQIGGPISVRGYPVAEFAGDKGIYSSLEWSFPIYPLPKKWKIPFRKETLYDSFRLVAFYDWGRIYSNAAAVGEIKDQTLQSVGGGIRFNLSDDVSARIEFGYPVDGPEPSDDKDYQKWMEFTIKF